MNPTGGESLRVDVTRVSRVITDLSFYFLAVPVVILVGMSKGGFGGGHGGPGFGHKGAHGFGGPKGGHGGKGFGFRR